MSVCTGVSGRGFSVDSVLVYRSRRLVQASCLTPGMVRIFSPAMENLWSARMFWSLNAWIFVLNTRSDCAEGVDS